MLQQNWLQQFLTFQSWCWLFLRLLLGGKEFLHWRDTALIPLLIPPVTGLAGKALFEIGVLQEQMPNAIDSEHLVLGSLCSPPPWTSFSTTVNSNPVRYTVWI